MEDARGYKNGKDNFWDSWYTNRHEDVSSSQSSEPHNENINTNTNCLREYLRYSYYITIFIRFLQLANKFKIKYAFHLKIVRLEKPSNFANLKSLKFSRTILIMVKTAKLLTYT